MVTILTGDCREVLKTLPDASVNCCVTSPPYWGLRDYGHAEQIGLERTPEEYVVNLVAVFREVRRLLCDDGTLWLNLGDSYATGAGKVGDCPGGGEQGERWAGRGMNTKQPKWAAALGPICQPNRMPQIGLKSKDMVGIPWRVAFALQADGWWLRSDIIWHKPNPMPESVTDRPTKSHEYLFLLAKSERYYYDAKAIMEPVQSGPSDVRKMQEKRDRIDAKHFHTDAGPLAAANHRTHIGNKRAVGGTKIHGNIQGRDDGGRACNDPEQLFRNKRDVWTVGTSTYDGAHFATFPPALIAPCILAGCPAGGTVLDPFGGSGTTGDVASGNGRRAVLVELNPEYAKLAQDRCGLFCSPNATGEFPAQKHKEKA
jgi:DNA modification methylase